jgi:ABC-2 type transport system ATP-binding protein
LIEVRGLTKYFGDVRAVDNVSFSVEKGEILGLLGPNAAGKTTTLRIITGFVPASRGTVTLAGYDVLRSAVEVKKRIGYLPENPPLYHDMRVENYLRFVAAIKGVPRRCIAAEVERVADQVLLRPVLDRYIGNLSKGYCQRVAFAQALLNDPPVLIFDEPTIGLDPKQIIDIRNLIKSLAHAHTVILSTHILPEVSMTCDRVAVINAGKLVAIDKSENLSARLKGSNTVLVEIDGPVDAVVQTIRKIPQVRSVAVSGSRKTGPANYTIELDEKADIRRELSSTIVENGWGLLGLKVEHVTLEDIYLKLTTSEETSS